MCATEASDGDTIVFCAACGAYATSNPRGLCMPCRGKARRSTAGYHNLERLCSGKHPVHGNKAAVSAVYPLADSISEEELKLLEVRLEAISRIGLRRCRMPSRHLCTEQPATIPVEACSQQVTSEQSSATIFCDNVLHQFSAPVPSTAAARMNALLDRVQAKQRLETLVEHQSGVGPSSGRALDGI